MRNESNKSCEANEDPSSLRILVPNIASGQTNLLARHLAELVSVPGQRVCVYRALLADIARYTGRLAKDTRPLEKALTGLCQTHRRAVEAGAVWRRTDLSGVDTNGLFSSDLAEKLIGKSCLKSSDLPPAIVRL
ncbi:unnamed protein product, partial [Protopolystoma xenopodis]